MALVHSCIKHLGLSQSGKGFGVFSTHVVCCNVGGVRCNGGEADLLLSAREPSSKPPSLWSMITGYFKTECQNIFELYFML